MKPSYYLTYEQRRAVRARLGALEPGADIPENILGWSDYSQYLDDSYLHSVYQKEMSGFLTHI